ncbi:MAG: hypothetical protein JRG83_09680 [Deltaproteobacteria bacterium]|nr:hypothetical protein [Deltaproteobacteria bacterium]
MKFEESFDAGCDRDHAVDVVGREETVLSLLGEGESEIVDRKGDRVTVRTHYNALGQEGTATFHFDYLMDGSVRFEKVCDGNVWQELRGELDFEDLGSSCCVTLTLQGHTQSLVPEFTVRGPLKEQVEQMAEALRQKIEA